jgi:hypothetical protein
MAADEPPSEKPGNQKARPAAPRKGRKQDFSWLKNWRVLTLCCGCLFAGFLVGMLIFGSPWHLPPAWGDIPTWITAIATIGLLLGAIITAIFAIRAFTIQSQQLEEQRGINKRQTDVLDLQVTELQESLKERQHEAAERRGAQAARVFVGASQLVGEPRLSPHPVNASDFPIYEAQLWYLDRHNTEGDLPGHFGTVLPGEKAYLLGNVRRDFIERYEPLSLAILTFRDAAGVTWIRTPDGTLSEIPRNAEAGAVQAVREHAAKKNQRDQD